VGTIVWLSSELMFFAALFAIYFTIRSVDKGNGIKWPGAHLDLTLGSINTTVLLLSSVTCQLGVFAVEQGGGDPDFVGYFDGGLSGCSHTTALVQDLSAQMNGTQRGS